MSNITPNQREAIAAIDDLSGDTFYVGGSAADKSINVNITGDIVVGNINLTEIGGAAISLGQKTSANSLPITIASDQTAIPVSQSGTWNIGTLGTITNALPSGTNVIGHVITDTGSTTAVTGTVTISGSVSATQSGTWDINNISGTISLPTGAATSDNQTNGNQQTQITDVNSVEAQNLAPGTANSSGNAQLVAPTSLTVPFSFTSVTGGTVYDLGNYRWVSVHTLGFYTGTTPTLTFQTSNDGTNWVSQALSSVAAVSTTVLAVSTTTVSIFHGPVMGRYFRLNQTGTYTSGTTTGNMLFSTMPGTSNSITGEVLALPVVSASSTGSKSIDANFGAAVSHASKASTANIFGVDFTSFDTTQVVYFQLFNKTTAPATNDVPIYSFTVGPAASATQPTRLMVDGLFGFGQGKNFATGLSWGISSTVATYNATAQAASNYITHISFV